MVTGGPYVNEDINRNLILDPGEDVGLDPGHGDGNLTPPSSAAGAVPATVTTDENGVGNFNLVYLKQSAVWIADEITASVVVLGTETTSTLEFRLPYLIPDEPYLPDSPYGLGSFTIVASAGANGSISLTPAGPPAGVESVPFGADLTFYITPDLGYEVDSLTVDGWFEIPVAAYTFNYVTEDHTINVTFVATPP